MDRKTGSALYGRPVFNLVNPIHAVLDNGQFLVLAGKTKDLAGTKYLMQSALPRIAPVSFLSLSEREMENLPPVKETCSN